MEQFLQDCDGTSLEISVERGGAVDPIPKVQRLERPYLFIGRDSRNDVCLDDKAISSRHAYLQTIAGRLYCVDLGSRSGVHWPDGRRISGWVEWNQPLQMGDALVRVAPHRNSTRRSALIRPTTAQYPMAPPAVVFEVAGARPTQWVMNRPFALIGGASACKVRLRHSRVSRFHCSLVQGAVGVWAVDLLSREGIRKNGKIVRWARLEEGDQLEIGPFVLRVRFIQPATCRESNPMAAGIASTPSLALPLPAGPSASLDQSMLLPVINEFNRMQQQMLEQFHQTMLMMAEMFSTLHREQASLVREELAEVRRLTQELNALHAERAQQLVGARAPVGVGHPGAPHAEVTPASTQDLKTLVNSASTIGNATSKERSEEPPGPTRRSTTRGATLTNEGAMPQPPSEPDPTPAQTGPVPDVHDWLNRRIAALQQERQGKWQKILHFITGVKG